jgi:hypothetical protein
MRDLDVKQDYVRYKEDTVTIHITAQEYLETRAAIAEARRRLQ